MTTAINRKGWIKKILLAGILLLLAGGTVVWYLFTKTFDDTSATKADFTVNAADLIAEFKKSDSTANKKYAEKIVTVNGRITATEPADTTVNLKITTPDGSYIIFAFQQQDIAKAKKVKAGDSVSIKGSCNGGSYSEILETEYISFKRCSINKQLLLKTKKSTTMKKAILILALAVTGTVFAQKKTTTSATVSFDATTKLDALPKAENKTVIAAIDPATGSVAFEAQIKGFNFGNPMMQEHFNGAKWMDSEKYPASTFKGTITNLADVKFDKDGTYTADIKGDLTMRGITKPLAGKATITVKGNSLNTASDFTIKLADYSISNAGGKLADEPKITVSADFK